MRLANRVLLCALAIFALCAVASAQTLRPENDPRNQGVTAGTGGSPGGPTGLFTIYDGDTLRRGEFTFSIAYSNYDRDPGDVDITVIPLSFNIGVGDHLELFFSTEGYRGVKVAAPKQLSSFYTPNSSLFFATGVLGSGPAIIQPPVRVSGATLVGGSFFRPAFNQPFVQFPFVGGRGPNFGLTGNVIAPPFVSTLGAPNGGNNGNYGAASNFPGYGSPCGSLLPGVVLTTRTIPPNLTFNTLTVPDLFTTCPAYLPDAPFINRLYGESAFGTMQVGAKYRFTGPNNPLGVALVGFYRFYTDKADDLSGFNQLQRGASPGGNFGDIGVFGIVSGRLSRSVSLHSNFGYILNSNPKGTFPGGEATLLDRPDELISGVGIDVVPNKYWQFIAELKSVHYVGGRTPNSFEQNPVDAIIGLRAYPARWWSIGGWFRENLNPQGDRFLFSDPTYPVGFQRTDDAHGFGFQVTAGHRNERTPAVLPNQAPTVSVAASTGTVTLPCQPGYHSSSGSCPTAATGTVGITTTASDPDGDTLLYTYSTTGGRITGDGANVSWDLSGLAPGTYTATVEVDDGCGCVSFSSTSVTVAACPDCVPDLVCPTVTVSCPDAVDEKSPATFTANFSPGTPSVTETYNWTVSAGTITSGQGTSSITVDTTGAGGNSITATVEVGGVDPSCNRTASCTVQVRPVSIARKFDEYGNIRFNDEKARLDNYAIQLQNEPTAQGTIIGYGSCGTEGMTRANRAKDYLVNTRGIDSGRIMVVDGGCMPELKVELWVVPSGAAQPTAAGTVSPCPDCKPRPRRRRGRGEE
ncbi:MAG TPA: hypothetical protein VJT71_19115 [Pyrinomonadaceae bacterium]|nr:hypothetical protein [Pyrinomonadaceae bacterium]